ncbi:DEAD/DEAH box helicase [Horticoccus sp. 23ND18S-11]|uniref:DEAD/DEAH box helicase n=1 Tax=Horticoccus sp. 23ND18S-11 TaxID=3391832 RepID=UPI0039C8E535
MSDRKAGSRPSIHTILGQFRDEATSNRDLGDRFERLMCRYFELDPIYQDRFSRVWMWNDFPHKGKVGDVGIDIVAEERATNEFCAIQCKFYLPDHTLAKEDIDSFFTAAGKTLFTSCMIVSTTDRWGKNAEHALANQSKPVTRLRVQDLDSSPIDWSKFDLKRPQDLTVRKRKTPRDHQKAALKDVVDGLTAADRGKLVMACGTGKTFTSLCIAERLAPQGHVLFLVPSLSLLSQSLREWTAEATQPLHSLAVCSDANIGKKHTKGDDDQADITTHDLAFPATTSPRQIVRHYEATHAVARKKAAPAQMTVVFSTYQSIQAVADAQKAGLPDFDLIICDEAHRTTGVTLSGDDESHFVKIHDATFIRGKKRLYMTATPRIYSDDTKGRAKDADAELCSMDDAAIFGAELHRLGFGEAVSKGLLSDYKVLVLAVDEKYVSKTFQGQIADANNELNLDDAVKITGCWNGLAKRVDRATAAEADLEGDTGPMRRAVAFSRSIKDSKAFTEKFAQLIEAYRIAHPDEENLLDCKLDHVDGTFNALRRNACLDWLKTDAPDHTCRILSNARCLSEGVDVPALDAVLFLNPRNSVIDVVQSVGRVMRRADGKKYGYIILPIGIPADMAPEEALKDNEKYKVVWQVLQALRAHDDRFNATVNQIELNTSRPNAIQVIGVGGTEPGEKRNGDDGPSVRDVQGAFAFPHLEEWKDAIFARIVLKCGDRRYWESWAKDVAVIAERHTTRIKALLDSGEKRHKTAFADFLAGLRENLNPSISADDAIEMLSQHLITRPVFDALFANYAFTQHNPVSIAMQTMLDTLEDQALEKETAALEKFYASVRERATGIDNAEGRQRIVIELYDNFFRTAFPKVAERLGIVYTPVEVVDFIIHSVSDVLRHEFNSGLGDKDVHIIDPFTGTGTFIVRLLQSGHIKPADLLRKYQHELHANEIVLLAYYIAAINIEETFHSLQRAVEKDTGKSSATLGKTDGYIPFEGIVLTDTFQISESKGEMEEKMFPENNRRVKRQKQSPIRVVIGNPPYSVGQGDANANNQNLRYPGLDGRIRSTYAERSNATLKNSLYDSYVRALRWASDRIEVRGVVGFVTNGSFIDSNALDGVRASLADEFTSVYVFNLRGNIRTFDKAEGQNVFGQSSMALIAISLFIKNPDRKRRCEIYYHDVGDYLTREEKLGAISRLRSLNGIHREKGWMRISPNSSHDWINQRDPVFEMFVSLGDKKNDRTKAIFETYSHGLKTNRDVWCYNYSRITVTQNIDRMVSFYNEQVRGFSKVSSGKSKTELAKFADNFVDTDARKISWSRSLKADLTKGVKHLVHSSAVRIGLYRPFCKQAVYFDRHLNELQGQLTKFFPKAPLQNLLICVTGVGSRVEFSGIVCDALPDLSMSAQNGTSQCFPLYLYEKAEPQDDELIPTEQEGELVDGYRRRSALTDAILADFRDAYDAKVTKEDIFYYVYGILHSPEYRTRFASDLKKMLPRIPFTQTTADFWNFSRAGRDLAHWHLNYETIAPYPVQEHTGALALDPAKDFLVQKMTFGRKDKQVDKSVINYNSHITLSGIPLAAYDYVVNGKPAIEWIMERYQITRDKDSGIPNDPNDWAREHHQPRYILDLLKRVITVSMETMRIVHALPSLNERVSK